MFDSMRRDTRDTLRAPQLSCAQALSCAQTLEPAPKPKLKPAPPCPHIDVHTSPRGTPDRVQWGGIEYVCGGIPLEWIWHRAWWKAEVPIGGAIDTIAWRLHLLPLPQQRSRRERVIDAICEDDGSWRVLDEITLENP